jgi:acetyl esterase
MNSLPLHPVIAQALAEAADLRPYSELPIEQARAQAMLPYLNARSQVAVQAVHDTAFPGPAGAVPVRVYTPPGEGPHPLVLFFHGSGFVVLGLESHDDLCRRLCVGSSSVVVSVDYRLAPEHKFPAAPDDCLAAARWAATQAAALGADAARMAVTGDSAGACLAAVTALRLRDEGDPGLCAQLLFYPVTDYPSDPPSSYRRYGAGYGLTDAGMRWFWEQYLPHPSDGAHPHASPLRMKNLSGLPPAYVVVAEYDVLRDEGAAFARRLSAAGIATVSRCAGGMNHGFLKYAGVIDEAGAEVDAACRWLRGALACQEAPWTNPRPRCGMQAGKKDPA